MPGLTGNIPFILKKPGEKHKSHNLVDITSRGLPFLKSLAELRPIANYAANGAMMDDYWDRCTHAEMNEVQQRITALLTGEDNKEPTDHGIYHQFWVLRQDAIQCEMHERHYNKYSATIHNILVGLDIQGSLQHQQSTVPMISNSS